MNIFGDKFISRSYEKINFIYYFSSFYFCYQVSGNDDDEIYLRKLDSCARSLFACDCERVFDKGTSIANRFLANAPIFCFPEPVDSRRFFVYARIMNKIRLKTFLVARKMFRGLLLVVC